MADNSFRFQLRRGAGQPGTNILKEYELGYDTNAGVLYIGMQSPSSSIEHTYAIPLNYLPLAGGKLNGALVLTEGINYGTSFPSSPVAGQIYFKKE